MTQSLRQYFRAMPGRFRPPIPPKYVYLHRQPELTMQGQALEKKNLNRGEAWTRQSASVKDGSVSWAATTMSNLYLPEELLDHVVDLLHDTRDTLKSCSLVSKSWIPRTRKHLFARVGLHREANLQSWKNTFPDPSTSPAHYTQTLSIVFPLVITAADAGEGGWIPTFSRVVHFEVDIRKTSPPVTLVPFHGFSSAIKSLCVTFADFPPARVSSLIHSFPLLEDLSAVSYGRFNGDDRFDEKPVTTQPSSPPAYTGSLVLFLKTGMDPIVSRLLSLPSGLHFRELSLAWNHSHDVPLTMALVESCSSTLESLCINCHLIGTSVGHFFPYRWLTSVDESTGSIDLSKATKLKDVAFVRDLNPRWITMTLRTITSNHRNIQQISVDTSYILYDLILTRVDPANFKHTIGATAHAEWSELDRLLCKLWESRLVRSRVMYNVPSSVETGKARICMESLFPEGTKRGVVDLVQREYGS